MKKYRSLLLVPVILGLLVPGCSEIKGPLARTADQAVVGQDPVPDAAVEIHLTAPKTAKAGQLVILDAATSKADSYSWKILPETTNFLVIESGRRAVFSSGTGGQYTVVLACAKGGQVALEVRQITIDGPKPTPADPEARIEDKVIQWCSEIQSKLKRDDALKLSQSFASMAAMISSGTVTSPEEILEATQQSNRSALGANVVHWEPFFGHLQAELNAMGQAGLLPTADAHARVWRYIAGGLAQYADTL